MCGGLYTLRGTRRPYPRNPHFGVLGGLLEGSWELSEGSLAPLGRFLEDLGLLEASWRVLEALGSDLGGDRSHLGAVLDGLEAILEALWELLGSKGEPKGHLMEVQKGPKSTP